MTSIGSTKSVEPSLNPRNQFAMNKYITVAISSALLLSFGATASQNFSKSKRELVKLYKQHPDIPTFYCRAPIIWHGEKGKPLISEVGYKVRKQKKRANQVEWEHILTAWAMGHQLQCWQHGGRDNCKKTSATYKKMAGDMHNLVPSIAEVNRDRSNYRYSDWRGPNMYGQCSMAVDFKRRQARPPEYTHGFIARDYLYMQERYGIKLTKTENKMMAVWAKQTPTRWECQRNQMIKKLQGNDNPFVTRMCAALNIR